MKCEFCDAEAVFVCPKPGCKYGVCDSCKELVEECPHHDKRLQKQAKPEPKEEKAKDLEDKRGDEPKAVPTLSPISREGGSSATPQTWNDKCVAKTTNSTSKAVMGDASSSNKLDCATQTSPVPKEKSAIPKHRVARIARWEEDTKTWADIAPTERWIVNRPHTYDPYEGTCHSTSRRHGTVVEIGAQIDPPDPGVDVYFWFNLHNPLGRDFGGMALRYTKIRAEPPRPGGQEFPPRPAFALSCKTDGRGIARASIRLAHVCCFEYSVGAALSSGDPEAATARLVVWQEVELDVARMTIPPWYPAEPLRTLSKDCFGDLVDVEQLRARFTGFCITLTCRLAAPIDYQTFPHTVGVEVEHLIKENRKDGNDDVLRGRLDFVECVCEHDPHSKDKSVARGKVCVIDSSGRAPLLRLPQIHRAAKVYWFRGSDPCPGTLKLLDDGTGALAFDSPPPPSTLVLCDSPHYINGVNYTGKWICKVAVAALRTSDGQPLAFASGPMEMSLGDVLSTATHELLHMFGLEHCSSTACVMYEARTGRTGAGPCDECLRQLRSQLLRATYLHPVSLDVEDVDDGGDFGDGGGGDLSDDGGGDLSDDGGGDGEGSQDM